MAGRVVLLVVAAALAGCTGTRPLAPPHDFPWHDARFGYDARLTPLTVEDVFRLDSELTAELAATNLQALPPLARAQRLMSLIFGPDRGQFTYEAGRSTIASDTWRRRRGDCISLTVLAYAAARALGLAAEIHEVDQPALHERRDGYDYVNHHVDLRIEIPPQAGLVRGHVLVIDFDPDAVPDRRSEPLSPAQVVARLYSNWGAERLVASNRTASYSWLKASLQKDPAHAPAYANLALLYRQDGLVADAEQLLRQAVAVGDRPANTMRALHQLLLEQGRSSEAEAVAEQLQQYRQSDPFYWLARAELHLSERRPAEAVRALERAQALTVGFSEIHRKLAIAYAQLGKAEAAQNQLALVAAFDHRESLTLLRKKQQPLPK